MDRTLEEDGGGRGAGCCKRLSERGTRTRSGQNKELRRNNSSLGGSSHVNQAIRTARRAVDIIVTAGERAMWGRKVKRAEREGKINEKYIFTEVHVQRGPP